MPLKRQEPSSSNISIYQQMHWRSLRATAVEVLLRFCMSSGRANHYNIRIQSDACWSTIS